MRRHSVASLCKGSEARRPGNVEFGHVSQWHSNALWGSVLRSTVPQRHRVALRGEGEALRGVAQRNMAKARHGGAQQRKGPKGRKLTPHQQIT